MYDSDEVRDAVRSDMRRIMLAPVELAVLDRIEWPAMRDARADYNRKLTEPFRDYMSSVPQSAAVTSWFASLAAVGAEYSSLWPAVIRRQIDAIMTALQPWIDEVLAALRRLGEVLLAAIPDSVIELIKELGRQKPGAFIWQRRGRVPDVRTVRGVDAVAAGRNPATIMRTRIQGGRR